MRVLLDTHALLWWLDGDRRLPPRVRKLLGDAATTVFVSAASVWEITTKARLGKLPGALEVAADVPACLASQGFLGLSVTVEHAQRAGTLPGDHRDPFDRMIIAQAMTEDLPVVTADPAFAPFPVRRVW
ncbi:MAG: type II toxin-antitoxin system VapC family toxin [Deltaproteobacteria bacterium]|nr:type II toxin-antitoxin system VapC family toxin [Deltaproteobacteria bacterium]